MKRKILSIILTVIMIVTVLPAMVSAEIQEFVNVQTVSAGPNHSLAVMSDGSLYGWGLNAYGQLGDGTTINRYYPVKIMDGVVSAEAGSNFSIALKSDGTVWTFGLNRYGELGDGSKSDRLTPVKIMDGVMQISAGSNHAAALKRDGSVWTWGMNAYGEIGNGTIANMGYIEMTSPKVFKDREIEIKNIVRLPVKVFEDAVEISAGNMFTAGLKNDGSVWGWGSNEGGQLPVSESLRPEKYMENAVSVKSTMGRSLILKNDGTLLNNKGEKILDGVRDFYVSFHDSFIIKTDGSLWAMGKNYWGNHGVGNTEEHEKPIKVADGVACVSASYSNSLIVKTDGSLWTAGLNTYGQFGNGTLNDSSSFICFIKGNGAAKNGNKINVSAGWSSSLALGADGSVWTWGKDNGYYEDGGVYVGEDVNDSFKNIKELYPLKVMDDAVMVKTGKGVVIDYSFKIRAHYMAIKSDGSLWGWGENNCGQLGDGTTEYREKPVKIMDDVKYVSVGGLHTAAIKTDGSLWVWGNNSLGQLGNTSVAKTGEKVSAAPEYNCLKPVRIMDNIVQVNAAQTNTFALKSDGSLWGWGGNFNGEIYEYRWAPLPEGFDAYGGSVPPNEEGLYAFTDKVVQTPYKMMDGVACIGEDYRDYHTVVKTDGSLWVWGYLDSIIDIYKNYGPGSNPVKIMDNVAYACAGERNFAAIKTDGSLWTWGNVNQQLGDGRKSELRWDDTPRKIMDSVQSVSMGRWHSAAVKTDGSIWTWGYNDDAQIGNGSYSFEGSLGSVGYVNIDNHQYVPLEIMNLSAEYVFLGVKIPGTALPKLGDPLGDVLYSDITAYINGNAIPTSVINGKTLVVVEDLAKYGFDVKWDGTAKTLKVEPNKNKKTEPLKVEKDNKPVGTFKEKYLHTDIKTYLSGEVVESYAINGVTLIDFDALCKYGKFTWDGQKREIKLVID